jgi:hypothetical protein
MMVLVTLGVASGLADCSKQMRLDLGKYIDWRQMGALQPVSLTTYVAQMASFGVPTTSSCKHISSPKTSHSYSNNHPLHPSLGKTKKVPALQLLTMLQMM